MKNKVPIWEKILAFTFGVVFVIALIVLSIYFPSPSSFQYVVFRIVLALSAAGIAAIIPGFVEIKMKRIIQAGGAIAVFVIVYFFSPVSLMTESNNKLDPQKKYIEIQKKLEKLNKEKNWFEIHSILVEISNEEQLSDLYNFFSGRLSLYRPLLRLPEPPYFLFKVPLNSEYFIRSRKTLCHFASLKGHENLKEMAQRIADEFEKYTFYPPYYFFLRTISMDEIGKNYSKLNNYYEYFLDKYSKKFNFNTLSIRIEVNKSTSFTVESTSGLVATYFLLHSCLAVMAHDFCLYNNKEKHINIVNFILKKSRPGEISSYLTSSYGIEGFFENKIKKINEIKSINKDKCKK